jgi:hypothetical protein
MFFYPKSVTCLRDSPRHGEAESFRVIFQSLIRRGGALFWGGGVYRNVTGELTIFLVSPLRKHIISRL